MATSGQCGKRRALRRRLAGRAGLLGPVDAPKSPSGAVSVKLLMTAACASTWANRISARRRSAGSRAGAGAGDCRAGRRVGGEDLAIGAVSIGNPAVIEVDAVASAAVAALGPQLAGAPRFRMAATSASPKSAPCDCIARVGSGAGETLACGGGAWLVACAGAGASMPTCMCSCGLDIHWTARASARMTGPAARLQGTWHD